MTDLTITHERNGTRGAYKACSPAGDCGHLTYAEVSPGVVVADHTYVPPALRGGGIAAKLVEALVADAREQGFRVIPQCSYVDVAFRRHPDWAPLRA